MLVTKAHLCVRHAASKDETRYNLNGVRFRGVERSADGGAPFPVTEATDGHMLIRVTAASNPDAEMPPITGMEGSELDPVPFILPLKAADELAALLKKADKRLNMPILANALLDVPHANSNGSVRFAITDLERVSRVESRKIDGEYPNVDSVIPARPQVERAGKLEDGPPSFVINLELLERVIKAAREGGFSFGKSRSISARFYVKDCVSPIRVEISHPDVGELLAVVMPMRL